MKLRILNILNTEFGIIITSMMLGLALASLFRKTCRDNNCVIIKGPPYKDIENKIFSFDSKCYTYKPEASSCENKNK